jgi:hypothetical protein
MFFPFAAAEVAEGAEVGLGVCMGLTVWEGRG